MAYRTTVTNYLIEPATNRARHPATMGSAWSCNMFREVNQEVSYLASVPGLKFIQSVSTRAKCRGAYVSSVGLSAQNQAENAFVCFGAKVFRIDYAGHVDLIGRVAGGAPRVTFAETGGLRPMLLVADGFNLWAYDLLEGGELKQVTLPARVTGDGGMISPSHVAVVGGSVCINDTGSGFVYYSIPYPLNSEKRQVFDIVDGEVQYEADNPLKVKTRDADALEYMFLDNYGVQQYFNAETSSDNIQSIAAVGSSLYLFGSKTIEIWQRGSGEYETWIRQSYTTNASNGLQAPYSVAVCGSNLYYLGSGESYAKGILSVSGQTYNKISDDWLDQKLMKETSDTAFGFAYAVGSHNFYVLQLSNLRETWVYDLDMKEWHQRASRVLESGNETRWRPSAMIWFRGGFVAFCDDGAMYEHSDDYWFEDYVGGGKLPMIRHRQGAVVVDEEKPFIFNELAIECSVGTWNDYGLQPDILLEVSKDGGNTFGNVRSCKLGRTGNYSHRVRFHNLGYNRLCVLRVTYSHPTPLELTNCSQRISSTQGVI